MLKLCDMKENDNLDSRHSSNTVDSTFTPLVIVES